MSKYCLHCGYDGEKQKKIIDSFMSKEDKKLKIIELARIAINVWKYNVLETNCMKELEKALKELEE